MTEREPLLELVTYTAVPAGWTATLSGPAPTGMVAITELPAVSITERVLMTKLATYTRFPDGCTATPADPAPTGTRADTLLLAVLSTETRFSPSLTKSDGAA